MKKLIALVLVLACVLSCCSIAALAENAEPIAIKALILPKFESGDMSGDFPG